MGSQAGVGMMSNRSDYIMVSENDQQWLRFWNAYPRRDAKKEARKAWAKIRPDAALVDYMLAALYWQVQLRQWQTRNYIPMPATWLNGERWTDEPPAGERVTADIHGHIPPCQSWTACTAKALAEARHAKAEVKL